MACAGLSVEASKGVIVLGVRVRHSLTGGTNFVDQGLIIIIYPYFEGVTIYRPEDIDKNIEIVQRHLKVSEVVKMFDELDSFQASQQHLEKSAQRLAKKELQQ